MDYNKEVIVFLLIWNCFQVTFGNGILSKPQILSNGDYDIVKAHGDHELLCQGKKPLKWIMPEVKKGYGREWTSFQTKPEKPINKSYEYGSRLYITNMTYPFVGYYDCVYENNEEQMDRKYIYVNDTDHLSVFYGGEEEFVQIATAIENQIAVIPCRPTMPDVNVTLEDVRDDDATLDPFLGFSSDKIGNEDSYTCNFERDGKKESYSGYISLEAHTDFVPAPFLIDINEGHTEVGDTIRINCTVYAKNSVDISWNTPQPIHSSRKNITYDGNRSSLTVSNASLDDGGTYQCNVKDHQKHRSHHNISIKVYNKGDSIINMTDELGSSVLEARPGQSVQWEVKVWGHPEPTFVWVHTLIDGENITIHNNTGGRKYEVFRGETAISLKINNINLTQDFGPYILIGDNNRTRKQMVFFLNVTDEPTVTMSSELFHMRGEQGKVECEAAGYPLPDIHWYRSECRKCPFHEIPFNEPPRIIGWTVMSEISIESKVSQIVKCTANNSLGSEEEEVDYLVTDVPDGFAMTDFDDSVWINNDEAIFAIGETIHVSCKASKKKYKEPVWLKDGDIIMNGEVYKLSDGSTDISSGSVLDVENVSRNQSGLYGCRVTTMQSDYIYKYMTFIMKDPAPARITDSNMNGGEFLEYFPRNVTFRCLVEGIPKPQVRWYKDDIHFVPNDPRISFGNNNQLLIFNSTELEDQGTYKCLASNRGSSDYKEVELRFQNAPVVLQGWLIYIIVILVIALVVVMVYLFIRVRTEQKLKQEMRKLGLSNFEKGAIENINPELGISDQAELLPYDRKWEFPIEQLKLGKQLGSGAFGVVLKGEAKHITEGEPVTTVAVKMVKKNADHIYIRALASELKIMVHLGKHLNVVNLLGACTKNVAKKELLVIVEYCRYGNLQNFLLRHRNHFIDQVDPKTGKTNYLIGQDELMDRTYSVSSSRSHTQSPLLKYAALIFSDTEKDSGLPPCNEMGDYRANNITGTSELSGISQSENGVVQSNNSIQPEWRSNYTGDYKDNFKYIATKDLIAWSFQVARGMEYLASRKVLHGDLAARNILLSDDNIVKICDFGLAKSMYQSENYKKRGDTPLPVKWMAIESIRDKLFSTQSDVWSFGIVLWEIFSLGRTPYPGMEADERLYHKLLNGYRLESPEYSPKDIYQIMTECWATKPTTRPTFTKLTEKIGCLLEDTLRKYYIDLNDPYLAMNTKMLEQNDYLAMINPPTFESVSSPHYVNDMVRVPSPSPEDGYMSMKPSTIFSPRLTEDGIFDFTGTTNRKNSKEEANGSELLPMLNVKNESDSPCPSPNAVSNPSYQILPKVGIKDEGNTEIIKFSDNYVNMPQNKNFLKDSETKSNVDRRSACT